MLDPRRLRVLYEIERGKSFAAAAERLGYTPSAVSQQIRALERELGVAVVDRHSRGATLSEPGRVLVGHAEAVLERLRVAEADVRALAGLRAGILRLGWFSTAGAILVPRAIARLRREHPAVELVLHEGDPESCVEMLRQGELDVAVIYRFPDDALATEDLALDALLCEQLYIALPRDHPLAGRERIALAELAGEQWIQGVRHGATLSTLPAACRAAGFEPAIAFRTDNPLVWQGLVAAGVGVAVVPQLILPTARPDIRIAELDAPGLTRTISVVSAVRDYEPPAARAMAGILAEVARDLPVAPSR